MEQGQLVYCEVTHMSLFRRDPEGRGIWLMCRGHKQEEFWTWAELGLTREALGRLLQEDIKGAIEPYA
jgi:hypothetical protein